MPNVPTELRDRILTSNFFTEIYVPSTRPFVGTSALGISSNPSIRLIRTGSGTTSTSISPMLVPSTGGTIASSCITSPYIASTSETLYITTSGNSFVSYYVESDGSVVNNHVYKFPKRNYRKIRFETNQAKKALWKSIRLFESLFGINDIRLFLKGDSFEITGRKFNYVISKRRDNLIEHTKNPTSFIIPYNLGVYNKLGIHLCDGCTVFKDTPIIDQITAVILHIKSGEEDYLLQNMNLQSIKNDLYFDHDSVEYLNKVKNLKLIPKLRC